jgi:CRP-like cAMP-binding protein
MGEAGAGQHVVAPHLVARGHGARREIAMPAKAGEMLFHEGDACERVFELRRGIVRGVSMSYEGDRQVTAFFFAGDQIGLPLSDCYRFTAEAVTDVLYVCQSRLNWHEALIRSCRDDGRLLPSICAEQSPTFRRGMIVGRNGIVARLSAFLLSIVDRLPEAGAGARRLPLPQTDIAAYLATSPESVCRAFRHLREQGVLATPRRDLIVVDRARLEAIAGGIARPHPASPD